MTEPAPTAFEVARNALAEAVATEEWPAYPAPPEAIEPPCFIVQPAPDYLESGETFDRGEWGVKVQLFLCVSLVHAEQAIGDLERMLVHALANLPSGWGIEEAGQPGPYHTADWLAFAMPLTVNTIVNL